MTTTVRADQLAAGAVIDVRGHQARIDRTRCINAADGSAGHYGLRLAYLDEDARQVAIDAGAGTGLYRTLIVRWNDQVLVVTP